jgi:hypothetical protein
VDSAEIAKKDHVAADPRLSYQAHHGSIRRLAKASRVRKKAVKAFRKDKRAR